MRSAVAVSLGAVMVHVLVPELETTPQAQQNQQVRYGANGSSHSGEPVASKSARGTSRTLSYSHRRGRVPPDGLPHGRDAARCVQDH